jgi:hypothetical protein
MSDAPTTQFSTAPTVDRTQFASRTGPPHNVLTQSEIRQISAGAVIHNETGELAAVQLEIPAKVTATRNENFEMVATANDYVSRTEQRMVFLGDPFQIGDDVYQFMGKLDIARVKLQPQES